MPYRNEREALQARRSALLEELADLQTRLRPPGAPRRRLVVVLVLVLGAALVAATGIFVARGRAPRRDPSSFCLEPIKWQPPPGVLIAWGWGGDIAGRCEQWRLYPDLRVEHRDCQPKGSPVTTMTVGNEAAARLFALAGGLAPYSEHNNCDPAIADYGTHSVHFYGHGTRAATKEEREQIRNLLLGLEFRGAAPGGGGVDGGSGAPPGK